MPQRARPGDVLAISTEDGRIYLQYLGRHPDYGDGVAVCPEKQSGRVPVGPELFRDAYVTFYPAIAAVAQGLAQVVGKLPCSGLPPRMRRPGVRSGRRIETWIVEDAHGDHVRRELTDEERRLPIASIWNHDFLIQRVSEGWRPEREDEHE
jgi:hypothetical protein